MTEDIIIRTAQADDAAALAKIYQYYVEHTAITFEYDAPDAAEMNARREKILEHYLHILWQRRTAKCSAMRMLTNFMGGRRMAGRLSRAFM